VKKMKWLGATGAVVALGTAGFLIAPTTSAVGVTPTYTAGPGSHVHCTFTSTTKLTPPLADDWNASEHTNDPSTSVQTFKEAIKSIHDNTFSNGGLGGTPQVVTQSKTTITAATCNNTHIEDATTHQTVEITGASITTTGTSAGTDEPTCDNLANADPNAQKEILQSTIKWTTATGGPKVAPTTAHSELAAFKDIGTGSGNTGVGFNLDSNATLLDTDISGSFGGGTAHTTAYLDGTTLVALLLDTLHVVPTVDAGVFGGPTPGLGTIADVCQPSLQVKSAAANGLASDSISIKVKKPKGLKAIGIGDNSQQIPVLASVGVTIGAANSTIDFQG